MNDSNDPVRKWAISINSIADTYRALAGSVSTHQATVGDSREFFIREILKRFLPPLVSVGTGQVINYESEYSRQLDIIIARGDYPVLTSLSNADIFLLESVIAAIEVKSTLRGGKAGTLIEALDNIRSLKSRFIRVDIPSANKYLFDQKFVDEFRELHTDFSNLERTALQNELTPSGYIFGYKGYKTNIDDLRDAILNWGYASNASFHEYPDVIVTEGCVAIKNDGRFVSIETIRNAVGYDPVYIARKTPEALIWMLWHLLQTIRRNIGKTIHQNSGIQFVSGVEYLKPDIIKGDWIAWGKYEIDNEINAIRMTLFENQD